MIDKSNTYRYTLLNRIQFYFSYVLYKLLLPFEIKQERVKMFLLESEYSLNNFFAHFFKFKKTSFIKRDIKYIESIFGKFYLRNNTLDVLVASPAFERRDVNFLLRKINEEISKRKRTLFIDIGADFGYYSIVTLNHNNSRLLKAMAFEPIRNSFSLLKKNIKVNNLSPRISLYNLGLLDRSINKARISLNTYQPGSSSIKFRSQNFEEIKITTLDKIINSNLINKFDSLIIKIDTEGCESDIMKGAKKLISTKKKVYVMVEDFMNPEIIETMQKFKFQFLCKISDYNSWWKIN